MPTPTEKSGPDPTFRVILAAAPWPLFNRPSIQLGALKAFVSRQLPKVAITAAHCYLSIAKDIGYDRYRAVSERTWLAESVYAAMLYPNRAPGLEKLFRKYAAGKATLKTMSFHTLVEDVQRVTDKVIAHVNWGDFELAGFTVSLCQLTSTLYFLKRIKEDFPGVKTVVGGTTFSGARVADYLRAFPDIDYLVAGEGEIPLTRLIRSLADRMPTPGRKETGLVTAGASSSEDPSLSQLKDLAILPAPDYDDYFRTLGGFEAGKRFFAVLPVEASRGCWWQQAGGHCPGGPGCAFCNLNLQWRGYRRKNTDQVIREVDTLSSRYQLLSLAFTDNVLPPESTERLFSGLKRLGKDFKLFAEIRASTPMKHLKRMRAAGMAELQVGIEALSSSLLEKMNKGVRAIQNMEIMKNCEALGINNDANLILYFPGSDDMDVAETLSALEYAMAFRPLKPVAFWLGLESPVWKQHKTFNIQSVYNHPSYRVLFPREIAQSCQFSVQAYRGDLSRQRVRWKTVRQKMEAWRRHYESLKRDPSSDPILGYRDGRSFLMIRHKQYRSETIQHRFTGTSRQVYLFCQKNRSVKGILAAFPELTEDRLLPFLKMMTAKRLMYAEHDRYLSLAVPLGMSV